MSALPLLGRPILPAPLLPWPLLSGNPRNSLTHPALRHAQRVRDILQLPAVTPQLDNPGIPRPARQRLVHIKQVADLLGHSSISITGDIYGHGSQDGARRAVEGLVGTLGL